MIIIFDLDDTLYKREDFVDNGLKNVSNLICLKNKILKKNRTFRLLKKIYNNTKITKTFDYFLKKNNIKNITSKNCVSVYRFGKNNIKLYPQALSLLKYYKNNSYLITDGNKLVQRYKIKKLNIKKFFKKIFITNEYGVKFQKPSLYCFEKIKKIENCKYNEMVYIGDNPNKDFINCNKIGIHTIRLKKGEFKNLFKKYPHDAKYKIGNLNEVNKVLRSI